MVEIFDKRQLKKLYQPEHDSSGEDNGQVTIIGGSKLFHGAPLLSVKAASRAVDMVFFASSEPSLGPVAERVKSSLFSFIWVPWDEVGEYVAKSDAALIGPGLMRFESEIQNQQNKEIKGSGLDAEGEKTKEITEKLLKKFPNKKWVIDAGSLQVMEPGWIPAKTVLTPNPKEFELLFSLKAQMSAVEKMAKKYNCTIALKGPETVVSSSEKTLIVKNGNPGLTKGGTGDCLAGITVALLAKNDPLLAAAAGAYMTKAAADELYGKVGTYYNADDLADKIALFFPQILR